MRDALGSLVIGCPANEDGTELGDDENPQLPVTLPMSRYIGTPVDAATVGRHPLHRLARVRVATSRRPCRAPPVR